MKSQKKRAVLIQIAPLWISQPRDRNRTIRHPPRDPTREALQKSAKSSKRSPKSLQQSSTGWRRLIGSPKLQIIFHKKATKCRSLLRKMTYKDKGSYESSPLCINRTTQLHFETIRHPPRDPKRETPQKSAKSFQKKNPKSLTRALSIRRQNFNLRQFVILREIQHVTLRKRARNLLKKKP